MTEYAAQLIVHTVVFSDLDYCNVLLAGLPACIVKPLQMAQNAAARPVFNQPKTAHASPLMSLMLAYRVDTSMAPTYLNSLIQVYEPSHSLRSANELRLDNSIWSADTRNPFEQKLLPN